MAQPDKQEIFFPYDSVLNRLIASKNPAGAQHVCRTACAQPLFLLSNLQRGGWKVTFTVRPPVPARPACAGARINRCNRLQQSIWKFRGGQQGRQKCDRGKFLSFFAIRVKQPLTAYAALSRLYQICGNLPALSLKRDVGAPYNRMRPFRVFRAISASLDVALGMRIWSSAPTAQIEPSELYGDYKDFLKGMARRSAIRCLERSCVRSYVTDRCSDGVYYHGIALRTKGRWRERRQRH